jgi:uncharacterized protein HemY
VSAIVAQSEDHLARGYAALASGDWPGAREAFASAVSAAESPEALDRLGRALWWLRKECDAVVYRERAYAEFRFAVSCGRVRPETSAGARYSVP